MVELDVENSMGADRSHLPLHLEKYSLDVSDGEPLFDEGAQAISLEDGPDLTIWPSAFTMRIHNPSTLKEETAFCWEALWLVNLSKGWKMHLDPPNGGLIPISDASGPVLH